MLTLSLVLVALVALLVWPAAFDAATAAAHAAETRPGVPLREVSDLLDATWWSLMAWLGGLLALLGAQALAFRRRGLHLPTPLLVPALAALSGLGLVLQLGYGDPLHVSSWDAPRHGLGVLLGGLAGAALLLVPTPVERWPRATGAVLVCAAAALLLALRLEPFAHPVRGQYINLDVGGLTVQPLELVKVLFALWLGLYLAPRALTLQRQRVRWGPLLLPRWDQLFGAVLLLALLTAGVVWVRDLGALLVLGPLFVFLFHLATASRAWLVLGFGVLATLTGWAARSPGWLGLAPERLHMWLDPWTNGLPRGTHLAEGWWTMAVGGLWGQGTGGLEIGGLAEGHTDMALATLVGERGVVGAWLYLALLGLLVLQGLHLAWHARSPARAAVVAALSALLLAQWLANFGGLVGWIPFTGVVAPFLTRGMSAVATHTLVVALLLKLAEDGALRASSEEQRVLGGGLRDLALAAVALLALGGLRLLHLGVLSAEANLARPALTVGADGLPRLAWSPAVTALRDTLPRGRLLDVGGRPLRDTLPDGSPRWAPGVGTLAGPVHGATGGWMLERVHDDRLRGYGSLPPLTAWIPEDDRGRVGTVAWHEGPPTAGQQASPPPGLRVLPRPDLREVVWMARLRPLRRQQAVADWAAATPRDLGLSLDARLQAAVAAVLDAHAAHGLAASVAVVDVDTGRTLARVQRPDVDFNDPGWREHLSDPRFMALYGPWLDRTGSAGGIRQAGSVAKLYSALARARAGFQPDGGPHYACTWFGHRTGVQLPGWTLPIRDHRAGPLGPFDLAAALQDSRNCWFAQDAVALGPQAFRDLVDQGVQVGRARRGADLAVGEPGSRQLGSTGFGQGPMAFHVEQAAWLTAAVASGGRYRTCPVEADQPCTEVDLLPDDGALEPVLTGLRRVMTHGTGRHLPSVPGWRLYGKSGTATEVVLPDEASWLPDPRHPEDHAWFLLLAEPEGNTEAAPVAPGRVAIAVLVFRGGSGAGVAGPIAVEVAREVAALREPAVATR